MEILIKTLMYICYVSAPLFTFFTFSIIVSMLNYPKSLTYHLDVLNGVKRTFHPMRSFIIAVISWAFLFANM